MRSTIFRQYDTRWGSLAYPVKKSSFADNGCGCCSCTHLIIEKDKYKNYTPKNVRPYMVEQGFAISGNGTTWDGITKTLEHYGYKVVRPNIWSDMDEAWAELNKGNRAGVLLFAPGTRGGVTWTSGGHYVAFLKYKVENGKHWFYTKDSGGRHNDGWHCYETTMRGLLPQMWIVELPKPTPVTTTKYTNLNKMVYRKKASTSSTVIATIPKGTILNIQSVDKNGWGKVTYNGKTVVYGSNGTGKTGYVRIKSSTTTFCVKVTKYKTLGKMNFRSKPNTTKESKVLLSIPKDKTIYVQKVTDGWGKLIYNGKSGYVRISTDSKTYCKKI